MTYFITIRTYGTWLHGDERGSVDKFHNQRNEPLLPPNPKLEAYRRQLMKSDPVVLSQASRAVIVKTAHEVVEHRRWHLHAINALTNHVHIVVTVQDIKPEKVMADFKAYFTRHLHENGLLLGRTTTPWAEHGSTDYIKDSESLDATVHYVNNLQ